MPGAEMWLWCFKCGAIKYKGYYEGDKIKSKHPWMTLGKTKNYYLDNAIKL